MIFICCSDLLADVVKPALGDFERVDIGGSFNVETKIMFWSSKQVILCLNQNVHKNEKSLMWWCGSV